MPKVDVEKKMKDLGYDLEFLIDKINEMVDKSFDIPYPTYGNLNLADEEKRTLDKNRAEYLKNLDEEADSQ
jgi:hypothetical protein